MTRQNPIVLGLGCDRGTPAESVETAILQALRVAKAVPGDVVAAASIDKKSDESGLLLACERHGWPITFYSAAQLAKVAVPNPPPTAMK